MAAILDLHQASDPDAGVHAVLLRAASITSFSFGEQASGEGNQVFLVLIAHHEICQPGQVPLTPLSVAAGCYHQGCGVGSPGRSQPVAGLAVRDVGDGAGVGDVDVGRSTRGDNMEAGSDEIVD